MIRNHISLVVLITFLSASGSAFAQASGSHGGDSRCQEFYSIASELSISLAKVGQEEIDHSNRLINVAAIRRQIMRPLRVIPAHNLDRHALSNPELDQTRLDVEAWGKIVSKKTKFELVMHEIMVLSGAESEGEYIVSRDAMNILRLHNQLPFPAVTGSQNTDGSVTIFMPMVKFGNSNFYISTLSSTEGACRYFGYGTNLSCSFDFTANKTLVLNDDGHITQSNSGDEEFLILSSITCI